MAKLPMLLSTTAFFSQAFALAGPAPRPQPADDESAKATGILYQ